MCCMRSSRVYNIRSYVLLSNSTPKKHVHGPVQHLVLKGRFRSGMQINQHPVNILTCLVPVVRFYTYIYRSVPESSNVVYRLFNNNMFDHCL